MNLERLLIVSKKEFFDQISGKKFLALFFMLMVIAGVSVISEYQTYTKEMEAYANSGSTYLDEYGIIHSGDAAYNPSPVNIYYGIVNGLSGYIFGPLIAISAGFNLITKERESGSIKSILSHPLYRDELINGKAIGGIGVLAVATVGLFVIITAILFLLSVVPSGDDFISIALLCAITILYLAGIFSMSLMVSSLTKNSGTSLIYSLILFIILSYVATIAAPSVSYLIIGPEPAIIGNDGFEFNDYDELSNYYSTQKIIENSVEYFSIKNNYLYAGIALTKPSFFWAFKGADEVHFYDYSKMGIGFEDILGKIWGNILLLIAYPIVFFGIAYVKFMRMDLR
ncbi:ABC transporter permease subunit [Methanolacinia paynteri]|uniref:ABC transporter permease subunit n=1 Tax=Methanolacinia paynteri TaxID=230356 RepID=UPI00064F0267|nr:ABC transporter permease subunit [Methanolacinia paynteri]